MMNMERMQATVMDERGRVTLGTKLAKRYGRRFFVVQMPHELILVPRPKDPVKDLQMMGKEAGLKGLSAIGIRKLAEEEAYRELDQKFKRIKRKR